jgi:hypothetical protein
MLPMLLCCYHRACSTTVQHHPAGPQCTTGTATMLTFEKMGKEDVHMPMSHTTNETLELLQLG